VWRTKGERFDVTNLQQGDRYGGGSVMVWGGIHKNGRTELVIVQGSLKFCEEIVVSYVVPFFQNHDAMIFQQDNARPHSANYTRQVLAENDIATLEWPSRSPDLSPIEHVWDILGRRIYARNDVNNVRQLEAALFEEWVNIPTASINKLINSMRKRCTAVIDIKRLPYTILRLV